MVMKKQVRKNKYARILNALGKGDNKKAWDEMVSIMADDGGIFILTPYEEVIKANKDK